MTVAHGLPPCVGVPRIARAVLTLLLTIHTVYAAGSTLDSVPALTLKQPSGEVDTTLMLFPNNEGVTPTEWLVSTSDGRQVWFDLEKLPVLRVSRRSLWLEGRRVTHLRSAHCYFAGEHASDDVTTCTYAAAQIVLAEQSAPRAEAGKAATPGLNSQCVKSDSKASRSGRLSHDLAADDFDDEDSMVCASPDAEEMSPTHQPIGPDNNMPDEPTPTLHTLGETSDIGGTLANYWSDGETVLVSPPLIADKPLTIFHRPKLDLPM